MLNFDWLSGISQETAKMVFFSLYIFIGLLVLIIPNEYIFQGVAKEERFWYKNLKLWALTVLGILATIYYLF
ncbi:hypothetical protein [Pareuzebyella sediminis]|uniref:hypothetical protein n=1 Tax=Pareuzebyella sediminis TaxID=2607998 RepID=UPI0011ECE7B3|nr:hypothetical protein [Pareuzebyella sediminis]